MYSLRMVVNFISSLFYPSIFAYLVKHQHTSDDIGIPYYISSLCSLLGCVSLIYYFYYDKKESFYSNSDGTYHTISDVYDEDEGEGVGESEKRLIV